MQAIADPGTRENHSSTLADLDQYTNLTFPQTGRRHHLIQRCPGIFSTLIRTLACISSLATLSFQRSLSTSANTPVRSRVTTRTTPPQVLMIKAASEVFGAATGLVSILLATFCSNPSSSSSRAAAHHNSDLLRSTQSATE
jgi:hypothetical protein